MELNKAQSEINSLYLETLAWVDKTYGNTYFASAIHINGEVTISIPLQYGYGNQDEYEALKALVGSGLVPASRNNLRITLEELGVDYYRSYATAKKAEAKRLGLSAKQIRIN